MEDLTQAVNYYALSLRDTFRYRILTKGYHKLASVKNYTMNSIRQNRDATLNILNQEQLFYFIHHYPVLRTVLKYVNNVQKDIDRLQYLKGIFIPIDIRDWILEHCTHQYNFRLEVGRRFQVDLDIWSSKAMSNDQQAGLLDNLALAIHIVTESYQVRAGQKIKICYFATEFNKTL